MVAGLRRGAAAAPTAIVVHLTLRVLVRRRGYELVEGAFRLLNLRVDHLLASEQLGPVGVLARRARRGRPLARLGRAA